MQTADRQIAQQIYVQTETTPAYKTPAAEAHISRTHAWTRRRRRWRTYLERMHGRRGRRRQRQRWRRRRNSDRKTDETTSSSAASLLRLVPCRRTDGDGSPLFCRVSGVGRRWLRFLLSAGRRTRTHTRAPPLRRYLSYYKITTSIIEISIHPRAACR